MAKAGMRRPDPEDPNNHGTENHNKLNLSKNEVPPVQEIKGKSKKSDKR